MEKQKRFYRTTHTQFVLGIQVSSEGCVPVSKIQYHPKGIYPFEARKCVMADSHIFYPDSGIVPGLLTIPDSVISLLEEQEQIISNARQRIKDIHSIAMRHASVTRLNEIPKE